MTAAGYPVPTIPGVSVVMTQPLVVTSPAGPTDVYPAITRPSTGSVGCLSVLPSLPVVSTPEGSPSSRVAPMDQCVRWTSVPVASGFPDPSSDGCVSSRW